MNTMELMEKKVELQRVMAARMDLELQIMKRMADIERMKESIAIQITKENELQQLIKGENK